MCKSLQMCMGLGGRQQPAQMCVDATLGSKPTFAAGTKLRLQIIFSVSVVFVSFLLRAVFSTMNAVANALQNDSSVCGDICASPCSNVFTQMQNWITLTPEFQLLVVLISSPLALGVALWGMTSDSALKMMRVGRSNTAMESMLRLSR